MGDREGQWQAPNGDTIIYQPALGRFVYFHEGVRVKSTQSEETARRWVAGED